jgi:hypothetical protein
MPQSPNDLKNEIALQEYLLSDCRRSGISDLQIQKLEVYIAYLKSLCINAIPTMPQNHNK